MKSGVHIQVDRDLYWHHGIYINRRKVIHFSGGPGGDNSGATICYTTPEEFAGGRKIHVAVYANRVSHRKTVERAKSQLGRTDYDLNDRNCEHFATWCVTGKAVSKQVGEVWGLGALALGALTLCRLPIGGPALLVSGIGVCAAGGFVDEAAGVGSGF